MLFSVFNEPVFFSYKRDSLLEHEYIYETCDSETHLEGQRAPTLQEGGEETHHQGDHQ